MANPNENAQVISVSAFAQLIADLKAKCDAIRAKVNPPPPPMLT
jgi:hypothetical protein